MEDLAVFLFAPVFESMEINALTLHETYGGQCKQKIIDRMHF